MCHYDSLPDVADLDGRIQTIYRGLCQPTIPDLVVACPELLSGIEIEIQSPDGSQEDTDTATGTATGTDTATDTDTTESPSEDS